MKKYILTIMLFSLGFAGYAQVGIGTASPTITFEVVGANDNGALTGVDGVLVPRVNDTDMSTATDGTVDGQMVYNTVAKKFYYWNGTAWTVVGVGSADGSETTVNAGTNLNVTGSGTSASPYNLSTNFSPSTIDLGGVTTADVSASLANAFLLTNSGSGTVLVTLPDPTDASNLGRMIIIDGSSISNSINFSPSLSGNSGLSANRSGIYYANGLEWVPIFEN